MGLPSFLQIQTSIRGLPLACKVIRNRTGEKRRRFYIRCKTEFDLQKRCSGHDNILQALSLTFKDEKAYLCTEFCPLGNLESLLNGNKGRPLPMEKTRSLFLGLLNGIHYLHNKHGIAHRDIKPANLLMSHDESIKIADFGSAVYAEAQPYISSDASLVSSYWSAPELLLDITAYAQDVDEDTFFNSWDVKDILSCDVYSGIPSLYSFFYVSRTRFLRVLSRLEAHRVLEQHFPRLCLYPEEASCHS